MKRILFGLGLVLASSACGPGVPGDVIAQSEKYDSQNLTQDAASLYWSGASTLYRVSKDGGDVATVADGQKALTLTVAQDRLCWVALDGSYFVRCAPSAGGDVLTIAEEASGSAIVRNLATDGTSLFWANANGEIRKAPVAGGDVVTFAQTDTAAASLVARDGVVWSSTLYGIARFEADGKGKEIIGGAAVVPSSLALGLGDDRSIYWTEVGSGGGDSLVLAATDTGSEPALLAQYQTLPSALAVDAKWVWWGSGYSDAHIRRVPIAGGSVEDFASGTRISGAPVVDEKNVYWLDYDGKLHRAPR